MEAKRDKTMNAMSFFEFDTLVKKDGLCDAITLPDLSDAVAPATKKLKLHDDVPTPLVFQKPMPDFSFFDQKKEVVPKITTSFPGIPKFNPIVSNNKKKLGASFHIIHSLSTLHQLLAEKIADREKPDLRFIIDEQYVAWFAREAHSGIPSPEHCLMTGKVTPTNRLVSCLAAGQMYLSDDYTTLISISNKSGDFTPHFHSLELLLALLVLNEEHLPFHLPDELLIKKMGESNCVDGIFKWKVSEIKEWIFERYQNVAISVQLLQKELDLREVSYEPTVAESNPRKIAIPFLF